ncbi:MAG: hypothetical protein GTO41_07030, partial [Burkholderiales bacterium]|nr:hypothetical protein [Burkholderiales bacterium]
KWDQLRTDVDRDIFRPDILVGPLPESDCIELVIARLGVDNETVRRQVSEFFQSTGGNPYFLDQLIDTYDPETGSLNPTPLDEVIKAKLAR